MTAAWHHHLVRLMMTLDPLVHDTFNLPLGDTGDVEGHSVIRTENGGYWYADDVSGDDHVSDAHAEIVRRVNDYPRLVEREKLCATINEAEKLALLRALQEIRDEVGLFGDGVSPKQIVDAVRRLKANRQGSGTAA